MLRARIVIACILAAAPGTAAASGHGPVFGGAPPTLGKGGWQLDQAWMGRLGQGSSDDEQMLRTMLSFGITEDLQISGSLPITLNSGLYMTRGRTMAMMTSNQDVEAILGWRFQRRAVGAGARLESTVFVGGAVPLQEYRPDGMLAAPSVYASVATGYASRAHYFWVGGGYEYFGEKEGDQMGDTVFYSAVYGYRPPFLRTDYPKPDLRFFVEAVGEHTARGLHHGFEYLRERRRFRARSDPRHSCSTSSTGSRPASSSRCISRRIFSRMRNFASASISRTSSGASSERGACRDDR